MSVIDILHPHSLGKDDCRAAVDAVAHDVSSRFGLDDMAWRGDALHFRGRGVTGELTVGAEQVRVRVELGVMLGLLRPKIEAEIRQQLRARLG